MSKPTRLLDLKAPHQSYYLKDGSKVPGTTTIQKIKAKEALLGWANKMGLQGKKHTDIANRAADIGSIAHHMAEGYLAGFTPDFGICDPQLVMEATVCYDKFVNWWERQGYTILHTELQLVSETYRYGGTLDWVAQDCEGNIILGDLKTSKGIYDDYWVQVAGAYYNLYVENFNVKPVRTVIVRIGKEKMGDFEALSTVSHDKEFAIFKAELALFNLDKAYEVEKEAA